MYHQPRPEILSRLPARKQSQSHTIQLSSQVLVVSIGIQLRVSVTVGQAIDRSFFPAGVHQLTNHARLTPAGHTFLGHARPRPSNTPQPDRIPNREVSTPD